MADPDYQTERDLRRNMMKSRVWLSIMLLVLASLACSVFGRAEEAIEAGKDVATKVSEVATAVDEEDLATMVPGASDEEEPSGEAPEGAEEGPDIESDALAGLQSYRTRFVKEWKPQEGEPEVTTIEDAHTRDPAARRLVIEGMADAEMVEIVQIVDRAWMCSKGTCNSMQADPEEVASGFTDAVLFDPEDVLDATTATLVGQETVNGVETRHYRLSLTAMEAAFAAQGDVTNVEGEAWVADEADLPTFAVRLEMSWTEERSEGKGQISFVYETYDVNAPFTIEPPEGSEDSGLPEDVPVYPNGEEVLSTPGMSAFETQDSVEDVADFYRQELESEGWTNETDNDVGDMVQQVWKKGERALTLVATAEDGGSSFVISVEGGS